MALEIRQSLRMTQQLVMTPQLQQAIKMLQLNRLELLESIQQELEENPVLEESPAEEETDFPDVLPEPSDDGNPESEVTTEVSVEETARETDIDWENYLGEYSSAPAQVSIHEERETPSFENLVSKKTDLTGQLVWQLRMSVMSPAELEIGAHIIGNLEPDGYLTVDVEDISRETGHGLPAVEATLRRIQEFDPPGVAARDLVECLVIQAQQVCPENDDVFDILTEHFDLFKTADYVALTKKMGRTMEELNPAIDIITAFDPKPGRAYSEDDTVYISPDIYVYKIGDEYVIVLNEDGMPKLKVNTFYRQALTNKGADVSDQAKEFIQNKLRSAVWLIRSIHQRQRTIYKVTESIVKFQRDFLEKGITELKPLVLRDVAEDVGMHESTISRVTTNKYVHTPQGLFELKFFFNSAIPKGNGDAVASESVKENIRRIIADEDPLKPLSDKAIADTLRHQGIYIARRTVAKYREMIGITSSSQRRRSAVAAQARRAGR